MNTITNSTISEISSATDDSIQSLINEVHGIEDDQFSNEQAIRLIDAASRTAIISGWIIGEMLLKVEEAISKDTPGFEYNSMSEWFDNFEGILPFRRSAAKQYKDIARSISLEDFSRLNYNKAKAIIKVKDETERAALVAKAIEEDLTTPEIQHEINALIRSKLPSVPATNVEIGSNDGEIENSYTHNERIETEENKNMYALSVQQWNPFRGCDFGCKYCEESSFQSFGQRRLYDCAECNRYKPHEHPERLLPEFKLDETPYMKFIFTCSSGDISFCSTEYFQLIVNRIKQEPSKNFLIQSKDPETFNRIEFPMNVILGTTLETNRDAGYDKVSKAPLPSKRYQDFSSIDHPNKMLTLEPMLDFDLDVMVEWICEINPAFIWIGTVSKDSYICKEKREPSLDKIIDLYVELGIRGFVVMLKDKLIKRIAAMREDLE
jgi:hypothetical protein